MPDFDRGRPHGRKVEKGHVYVSIMNEVDSNLKANESE
jgi:hypothetical protein